MLKERKWIMFYEPVFTSKDKLLSTQITDTNNNGNMNNNYIDLYIAVTLVTGGVCSKDKAFAPLKSLRALRE